MRRLFSPRRPGERVPFIEAEKAQQCNVAKACALLEVSRSAFYDWHHHLPSARRVADDELGERIEAIWNTSRGTYGWPRVHAQLRRHKVHVGGKRVARIMRQRGLIGRCRRRWKRTTIPDREATAVDLLKRAFGPGTVELDRVYVGDITYVWTWEGWAYLATVIDLASRKVVRVHRAGEGAPFTGLKPAGLDVGPVIPVAEEAIASGSPVGLIDFLTSSGAYRGARAL